MKHWNADEELARRIAAEEEARAGKRPWPDGATAGLLLVALSCVALGRCSTISPARGSSSRRAWSLAERLRLRHRRSLCSSDHAHRIYQTSFASVYPHYVAKAEKKGRTKAEVDEIIRWLTGYSQEELEAELESGPISRVSSARRRG